MKKSYLLIIVVLLIILSVSLVACGKFNATYTGLRKSCITSNTDYKLKLECEYFKGSAVYRITTDEDHTDAIHYEIEVKEMSLDLKIYDVEDNEVLSKSFTKSDTKYIGDIVVGYGKCRIEVTANEFNGSYYFNWEEAYNYPE